MNYFKQGDVANADKIKAAFKAKGIDVLGFGFADKTVVYCSIGGVCVQTLPYSVNLMNILYSHPDYQELELVVKPKFKVGDWVVSPNGSQYLIAYIDKEDNRYLFEINEYIGEPMHYEDIQVVDSQYHLWSIADAKDGDVLCTYEGGNPKIVFILRGNPEGNCSVLSYYCYYNIMYPHFEPNAERGCLAPKREDVKPSTKEQRDLLFAKMREAGYEWDGEKKELRKIKPHYGIANFQPFDKVLGRNCCRSGVWRADLFSHIHKNGKLFVGIGYTWEQCIPYNDDTKHLLGTTDMPSEEYINW